MIQEGFMPFRGLRTYYRIVGEGKKTPLVLLHGGPGSTHNYFEVLDCLATDGRKIISYDQIGCGKSPAGHRTDLFNREVWVEELTALLDYLHIEKAHILGQSWGGMLLLEYVCKYKPATVQSMILASTLPNSLLWGEEQHRMINQLPEDMKTAILDAERRNDFSSEEVIRANEEYMLQHCAPKWPDDAPECLCREKGEGMLAYLTAWGPNEYTPSGNLKDYDVLEDLKDITVPTLITSGTNDLCTPYIAKTMYDGIPGARWELFRSSRHMAFAEENEKYVALLRQWLAENDEK